MEHRQRQLATTNKRTSCFVWRRCALFSSIVLLHAATLILALVVYLGFAFRFVLCFVYQIAHSVRVDAITRVFDLITSFPSHLQWALWSGDVLSCEHFTTTSYAIRVLMDEDRRQRRTEGGKARANVRPLLGNSLIIVFLGICNLTLCFAAHGVVSAYVSGPYPFSQHQTSAVFLSSHHTKHVIIRASAWNKNSDLEAMTINSTRRL